MKMLLSLSTSSPSPAASNPSSRRDPPRSRSKRDRRRLTWAVMTLGKGRRILENGRKPLTRGDGTDVPGRRSERPLLSGSLHRCRILAASYIQTTFPCFTALEFPPPSPSLPPIDALIRRACTRSTPVSPHARSQGYRAAGSRRLTRLAQSRSKSPRADHPRRASPSSRERDRPGQAQTR